MATYQASQWFRKMTIDEVGDHRVRNKKESDHNTILAENSLHGIKTEKKTKSSDWNYKAQPEKWQAFREEVQKYVPHATELMSN